MPGRLSPLHLLLWLLAVAVGVSGWIYGWHWKSVVTGSEATHEEKLIISLQDQLDILRAENDRLTAKERTSSVPEADPSDSAEPESIELPKRD